MGREFPVEVETMTRPREHYRTEEFRILGLPAAPAILLGEEVLVQGKDLADEELIAALRRRLG